MSAAVSPRDLVLRSGDQLAKSVTPVDIEAKPDIGEGNQRLHSFYRPGLAAGTYNIDVEHRIAKYAPAKGQNFLTIPAADRLDRAQKSSKSFTVVAPQYSLPAGSVNMTYPAPGHQAPHTTLAHVVLNDAQLPWERVGSNVESTDETNREALSKTRTPWLAVLLFTQEEIMLPADIQGGLETSLELPKSPKPFAPSPTFTYNVNMAKFIDKVKGSKDISTPLFSFDTSVDDADTTLGDIVCVKKEVLQELVRTYNDQGQGQPSSSQPHPDVSRYRWLAHVRQVDTAGMAQAGSTTGLLGERDSLFSVVFSHRTGPLNTTQPTSVIAHLVSIEGLEAMSFPFTTPYVALTSLHSWSYMSLPPESVSLQDSFKNLGNFKQEAGIQLPLMRAPVTEAELGTLRAQGDAGKNVARRLETGYSLARYRLQTGEQSVSFYRGPLIPAKVPYPLQDGWDAPSTHGTDRQIFDRQVGIMDISYSTAWQLGRTLALADRTFTVALARLRRQIQEAGVEVAKREEMEKKTLFRTKLSTIQSLSTSMNLLERLPASDALLTSDVSNRWKAKTAPEVNVSFNALSEDKGETQRQKLQRQLNKAAEEVSASLQNAKIPYDEFNSPRSTDWMTVLKWALDKMYLADIPANYLISDPSHLPLETIRFFEIDRNWTDSLIDGALSLANHLERDDDMVRRSLQHALRQYLGTPSQGLKGVLPPVPMYGFLLRSELITAFPDMVVKTEPTLPNQTHPVMIRHHLLDTNVMLCLFDRVPTKGSFESVTLSQPPHQPCFSVAADLTTSEVEIHLKSVYSGPIKDQPSGSARSNNLKDGQISWKRGDPPTDDKPTMFTWDANGQQTSDTPATSRFLNTNAFANWAHKKVVAGMKPTPENPSKYTEDLPTSSLVAYQLNDPSWQLKIQLNPSSPETESAFSPPVAPSEIQSSSAIHPMRLTAPMTVTTKKKPTWTLQSLGKNALKRSQPLLLPEHPPNTAPPLPTTVLPPSNDEEESVESIFVAYDADSDSSSGDDPASLPKFTFAVFPLDIDPNTNPNDKSIPLTPSPLPQDLIFSILLTSPPQTLSNFHLQKITLRIPFTRSALGKNKSEVLMTDYTGPGGIMATNLRFNVVCSLVWEAPDPVTGASTRLLKIELLPRTHLGRVFAGGCRDLTFLLGGVVVAEVNKAGGEILGLDVSILWDERVEVGGRIPVERRGRKA